MKGVFLITALIFLTDFGVKSQIVQSETLNSSKHIESGEKIRLFTDRNIYCVNEKIFFTIDYVCIKELDSITWSNVIYVELIKWNGIKLAQLKLKLDKSGSSGCLQIPGDLLSGNYYLRAYTKWMQNYSASDYGYLLVKIVNPFNAETDAGPAINPDLQESVVNRMPQKKIIKDINCSMNKSQYQTREKAEVELFVNDNKFASCRDYCVSVAKVGTTDTSFFFIKPESSAILSKIPEFEYLPEIRGITISGKIADQVSNKPKKEVLVSLSEPLNGEYFSVYQTTDKGRFVFSLPDLYGKYDFFIQAETPDTQRLEILIDNGFCNQPVLLPYIAFQLSDDQKQLIREMMINMQLREKFLSFSDTAINLKVIQAGSAVFYGNTKKTYNTKNYVELPNLEEFFIEIIPEAYLKYNKGKPSLINAGKTSLSNYSPLILLDNIPVSNDERLLKLPLNRIERIEAIDKGYIVANMKYDGLISIYSKKKDFAGIDLNKNNMFFTYELFSNENSDLTFDENSYDSRIPDTRNLLYWNPDIRLSPGQKITFSFYTSDDKGDYVVYIFGKNNGDDKQVYGKCFFSVN
jgi:hypothetical protein